MMVNQRELFTDSKKKKKNSREEEKEKEKEKGGMGRKVVRGAYRSTKNLTLFLLMMYVMIKVFHYFRLYDTRKKIHFPKPVIVALKYFESYFRMQYCMGFCAYHAARYFVTVGYYSKVKKLPCARRGRFGELLEEEKEVDVIMNKFHEKTAEKILQLCQDLGGIFIKFGQEMSMFPVLPKQYLTALSNLHDNVRPLPWKDVESLIFDQFKGKNIEDIFVNLTKTPVASASLAQVYKWKLKKENEVVAVKVQYPMAKYYIEGDILIQMLSLKALSMVDKNFKKMYEDMKENMGLFRRELDFENEAKNQMKCGEFFRKNKNVTVPYVYQKYSTDKIITMEWKDGVKPTDIAGFEKLGFTRRQVARGLFSVFGDMIFKYGFIHGDLHAGNIFVSKRKGSREPEIVLLDHGLYTQYTKEQRLEECRFWKALILGNQETLKDYCSKRGINNHKMYISMILMQNYDGVLSDVMHNKKGVYDFKEFEKMGFDKMKKGDPVYEDMQNSMQNMPKEGLFVFRSAFILGFINSLLGAPVNRFTLMSRIAARTLHAEERSSSVSEFFSNAVERVSFEMKLLVSEFKSFFAKCVMKVVLMYLKMSSEKDVEKGESQTSAMGEMMKNVGKRYEMSD